MSYKNAYNAQIAEQVRNMSHNRVDREKRVKRLRNKLRDSFASGVVRHALS